MELILPSIEDAVIRLSAGAPAVTRVVVDGSSTSFLAYTADRGYAPVDFERPTGRLRELGGALGRVCDLGASRRFFAHVYREMIELMAPDVEVVFRGDGVVLRPEQVARGGPANTPPISPSAPPPSSVPARGFVRAVGEVQTLVAFGDSSTFGAEIDSVELGRADAAYRTLRAYPSVLARELGIRESINCGESGSSNGRILRNVCDFVRKHRTDLARLFVVVGLTHPSRKSFVDKRGREVDFVNIHSESAPRRVRALCDELFVARRDDAAAQQGLNAELEHKCRIVCAFLRGVGVRFVVFPCWDFADSSQFFRDRLLDDEAIFYFGSQRDEFGMAGVVRHLAVGPQGHPLSEGHALFARELAEAIRARELL